MIQQPQRVVQATFPDLPKSLSNSKILTEAFGNAPISAIIYLTTLKLDNATASVGSIITPQGENGYRDRKNLRLALLKQPLNEG